MVIGVLKEIKGNEYRVAAVPATVHEIVRHGHTVYVETGAGVGSGFSDAQYEAAGAIIADTNTVWEKADLYYKVKELFPQEFKWMNKDKILFTYIHSNAHPDETDTLLNSHVSAVAYEDVQDEEGKFPLLRPMSELAGKGGFLAALPFTGMEGLWRTGSATALVLAAAGALVILINTAYQDGEPDNRPPAVLRLAVRVASVLLTPLIAIAVWGLSLRIGQYGLTPDRIIASACALLGAVYAGGYGFAALSPLWRGGDWMKPLERTNVLAG